MSKFSAAHCTSSLCEADTRAPGKKYAKDLHYQSISCRQLSERIQYSLARFFSSFRFQSGSWKNSWRVMWSARKKSSGERWSSRWLRSTSSGNLRFVTRSCCIYRKTRAFLNSKLSVIILIIEIILLNILLFGHNWIILYTTSYGCSRFFAQTVQKFLAMWLFFQYRLTEKWVKKLSKITRSHKNWRPHTVLSENRGFILFAEPHSHFGWLAFTPAW